MLLPPFGEYVKILDPDSYFYNYGSEHNVNIDGELGGLDIEYGLAIAKALNITLAPYIPDVQILEEVTREDAVATVMAPLTPETHKVQSSKYNSFRNN